MHNAQHGRAIFNFNSDLSGDVLISVPSYDVQGGATPPTGEKPRLTVTIEGEALIKFVSNYLRRRLISHIEQIDVPALLKGNR